MKFYILAAALILSAYVSFAASPYFFKGYVHVNDTLAPNGTIVEVYLNGTSTLLGSAVTGHGLLNGTREGWYTIAFEANAGDTVAFRVNNITLITANGTNTSAQTLIAGGIVTENFNLSVNKTANGVSCLYAIGCSSGFCVDSYCCNSACSGASEDCNVAGSLGTCTSTATTTSTGGGGGGGAASTTSETVTVASVSAGSTATASISSSVSANIGVEKIEFTAATAASNVQVTVKETTQTAAGVTAAISSSGAVYKYLEITKTNIKDADISSAKISFKVPKSWINTNNIDRTTITLNRFSSNTWSKLSTTLVKEDSTYVYYSATAAGFSTFAVTGEKRASFFDVIKKIDDYYSGKISFFDVTAAIDLYYKGQ